MASKNSIVKSQYVFKSDTPVNVSQALKVFNIKGFLTAYDMVRAVKIKFRKLSKQYHPDCSNQPEKMKELSAAYEIIKAHYRKTFDQAIITCYVPSKLKEKVNTISQNRQISISSFVRDAIKNYIKELL